MPTQREQLANTASDERGFGLLMTLLVLATTVALGINMISSGVTELEISGNYRNRATAHFAADSGIEQTYADLRNGGSWVPQLLNMSTWTLKQPFPSSFTVNGLTINVAIDGSGNAVADSYTVGSPQTISSGTFSRTIFLAPTVELGRNDATIVFATRSTGTAGTFDDALQVIKADLRLHVDSHGVWDNAIFAGSGAAGNAINGNVAIRGSIHIVGDPLSPPTIAFSGTADVRNNYATAVSEFGATDAAKLPALPTVDVDGVSVETMEAIVRLKHGTITISGAGDIGQINDNTNGYKETIDSVRADGTVTLASDVYTDDWGGYDAADLAFPTLDDPYTDPATGTLWAHHRDFLDSESLTITETEISTNVAAFSHSDGSGNSIAWDPSAGVLNITGIIKVAGDIHLGRHIGPPDSRGLEYSGTGTIYSTDDLYIDGDLGPVNNYIHDGNLGLIADTHLHIANAAQIDVMAAIYGEDQVTVAKQTIIAGAIVSNYFDMGSNVPSIYHVPLLPSNLPPGMPGGGEIGVIKGAEIRNWFPITDR